MRLVHDNGNEIVITIDGSEVRCESWCDGQRLDDGTDITPCDSDEAAVEHVRRYVLDLKSDGYRDVGGRPTVGKLINVRLPADVIAAIDAIADREGTSRAAVMRRLLATGEHV